MPDPISARPGFDAAQARRRKLLFHPSSAIDRRMEAHEGALRECLNHLGQFGMEIGLRPFDLGLFAFDDGRVRVARSSKRDSAT